MQAQQHSTSSTSTATAENRLLPGIDRYLAQTNVDKNKRLALVCNNASLTSTGLPTRVALVQNGFNLVKLFSPEHGLNAAGADGAYQQDGRDELTGLPVTSLYGERLSPGKDDLEAIDLVLFDIPDIGCRFYTYLWTMTFVMEACAKYNVPFIITDRANPIGGNLLQAEGPMLDEINCASFIGRWSVPIRHCCTLGELALYFASARINNLNLQVIPVSNWNREAIPDSMFTPTSPAIQKRQTAVLYPGMGLLEGINVNEGRGTDVSFEICGAPWIDSNLLYKAFMEQGNPGINGKPYSYTPADGLYAGELCHGLHFSVTNETIFRPVQTGLCLLQIILELFPVYARERLYRTLANPGGGGHLDKLLGIPGSFVQIKNGEHIHAGIAGEWASIMKPYLLY